MFLPSNLSLWYLVSEFFVTRRHKVHRHPTLKCQLNEQIEWFCPDLTEGYVPGNGQVLVQRMNTYPSLDQELSGPDTLMKSIH